MSTSWMSRVAGVGAAALALVLVVGLAGCSSSGSTSTGSSTTTPAMPTGSTAKGQLATAQSALSTMAPDAKLLLVTTAEIVSATSTPVWQYLFGSPKTDKTYSVTVMGGRAMPQQYGDAGMTANEWMIVPSVAEWKVDSDAAVQTARELFAKAGGKKDAEYVLGMVTYVPKSAGKSNLKGMTWAVSFNPVSVGKAPTTTVDVNARTGEAAFAK
jgi:hypothetical protein